MQNGFPRSITVHSLDASQISSVSIVFLIRMKRLTLITLFTLTYMVVAKEFQDIYNENEDLEVKIYNISDAPQLFKKFIEDYNKTYKNEEEYSKRFKIFVKNLEIINKLNSEGGTASYDINPFADMEDVETDTQGFIMLE